MNGDPVRSTSPVLGILLLALAACASSEDPPAWPYVGPEVPMIEDYRLGVGDVFDLVVYDEPGLSKSMVVRPDGKIAVPLMDEVYVVGLTPAELDAIITEGMSRTVVDPEVSVILKQFAAQRIFVAGEVARVGEIPLSGRMSLLQALIKAGGPLRTGDAESVVILRNAPDGMKGFEVDLEEQMDVESGAPFWLHPYDVVFVPKTTIASMNEFVDQYIRQLLPISMHSGFNWVYQLNDSGGNGITISQ